MAESSIQGFNLNEFAAGLGNVTQNNQFYANIELPQALQAQFTQSDAYRRKIGFSIEATSVPTFTVGEIPVSFRGQKIRLPGDRDMSGTWDVTIRADVNTVIREVHERWNDALVGNVEGDTIDDYDVDILALMGVGEVHQLSRNGKILKSWHFNRVWPSVIGAISYDWTAENTIVKFDTTLVFQNMESNSTRNNVITESEALSGTVIF